MDWYDLYDQLSEGKEVEGYTLHLNLGEELENFCLEAGDADRVTTLIIKKDGKLYRGRYWWSSWGDGGVDEPVEVQEYPVVTKQWLTDEEADKLQWEDRILPREEH